MHTTKPLPRIQRVQETTWIFPVNLQQGFVMDNQNHIIAAYSHHKKTIYVKVPWNLADYILPENYRDYTVFHKITDSFSIEMYTSTGNRTVE